MKLAPLAVLLVLGACAHKPAIALSSETTPGFGPGAYSFASSDGAAEALVAARLGQLGFSQGAGLKVTCLWTVRPAGVGAFVPESGEAGAAPKAWLQSGTQPTRWQRGPRSAYSLLVVFSDPATGKERYRVRASLVAKEGRGGEVLPLLVNAALASAPLIPAPEK